MARVQGDLQERWHVYFSKWTADAKSNECFNGLDICSRGNDRYAQSVLCLEAICAIPWKCKIFRITFQSLQAHLSLT